MGFLSVISRTVEGIPNLELPGITLSNLSSTSSVCFGVGLPEIFALLAMSGRPASLIIF
jgi:hypothetical protein